MRKSMIALSIAGALFTTAAQAQPAPAPAAGAGARPDAVRHSVWRVTSRPTRPPRPWRRRSPRSTEIAAQLEARHRGGRYQRRPRLLPASMDQTQVGSIEIAIGKARTAARFRRESAGVRRADGRRRPALSCRRSAIRPRPPRPAASRWSKAARSSARSAAAARPAHRIRSPARPAPRRSSRSRCIPLPRSAAERESAARPSGGCGARQSRP